MRAYRLLLDLEAVSFCHTLRRRERVSLFEHLEAIRAAPAQHSDGKDYDRIGREIEISVHGRWIIHYWIDFPDRHIKVLEISVNSAR